MKTFRVDGKSVFDNESLLVDESIYSTANGYIGVRGNFEEGYNKNFDTIRGSYINGYYETHDIKYSESAYGFPDTGETMMNVIDGQTIKFLINGELFSMESGRIIDFERKLDVKNGYSVRKIRWVSSLGDEFVFEFKRMASFVNLELFLIDVKVLSVNFDGDIEIISTLEAPEEKHNDGLDPRIATHRLSPLMIKTMIASEDMCMEGTTENSKMRIKVNCHHSIDFDYEIRGEMIIGVSKQALKKGETLNFTKYLVFTDDRRHVEFESAGNDILRKLIKKSSKEHFDQQRIYLDKFWETSKVEIKSGDDVQEVLSYNMYQLLASAGKDFHSQISAKGLSGAGYEGHYFWDTEIYLLPFFTLTNPEIARNLLKFRYTTLEQSKARAKELGHEKGAKIPWRTISGRECSSYFPAGTAQYHINADVAYSYIQYYLFTNDFEMIKEFGFEVLIETARLWLEVGHYHDGMFKIDAVTGPDEYTAIVNNNYYTNSMAKYHMEWVVKLYAKMLEESSEKLNELNVYAEEIELFERASKNMHLPYDKNLNIDLQDDTFIQKKVWDFENTPKEKYPLLLHYHPLTIYRHQVLKQADTVLAHFLLDNREDDIIKASYLYYESVTTHDSSLSPCVYGMMASRINDPQKAYGYFMKTINLDLKNTHGNTKDGLHIANAGGAYMAIVFGFAGLRISDKGISLKPTKPKEWDSYKFRILYESNLIEIEIGDKIKINSDMPIRMYIDHNELLVDKALEVDYIGKH